MEPFKPHPNLSEDINRNIAESELQGGAYVRDLTPGTVLTVKTRNSTYTLERGLNTWFVSGGTLFPQPVPCIIVGSTWGGSMCKMNFIDQKAELAEAWTENAA